MLETINLEASSFNIAKLFKGEKAPLGFYRKTKNRIKVIHYLVENILNRVGKEKLTPLTVKDFKLHGLYGMLTTYYNCSPRKALEEAYSNELTEHNIFEDATLIIPSFFKKEIPEFPRNFLKNKDNRSLLTKYFVKEILKKDIYEVSAEDFRSHGLNGFITHYFGSSPIKAISEAYPEALPFLFCRMNAKDWQDLEFRKSVIDYYIAKLNLSSFEEIYNVSMNQMVGLGLKHSIARYYHGDIVAMIMDCYPALTASKFKYKSRKK